MSDNIIDTEKEKIELSPFPFQMVDIRLYEIYAERCDPEDKEASMPVAISLLKGKEPIDADEFGLLLKFETGFPADEKPHCKISLALEGYFKSIVDVSTIKEETINTFKNVDALVLFWPYLRQTVHDLTNRMRLDFPPLPLIDPRGLINHGNDAEEKSEGKTKPKKSVKSE